jgi:hypothetical protein
VMWVFPLVVDGTGRELLGKREMETGESSLGEIIESLVPSYRDIVIKKPLPIFLGAQRLVARKKINLQEKGLELIHQGRGSKQASWTCGLGSDVSPLKTRSARKKVLESRGDSINQGSNISEQGALRGIKALAREK